MVNIEIVVGIIALGVLGAVFIPLAFDPKGEFDLIQCEENEIITFDAEGNAICDTVVPVGDGSGSFANENTEFRPHLVQGDNVQDPIIDFGEYKVRVMEFLPTVNGSVSWDYLVPEQYEAGEDLQWTLYWFKEDGVQDLSVIPHHYEEVTTCGQTDSTAEILTVQDGVEFDFEEGESYLLMANTMWSGTDPDGVYQIDVRHGGTIFEGSHMREEPVVAGSSPCNLDEDGYKYFWWTVWTPNATEATQDVSIHATAGLGNLTATPQQYIQETGDDAEQLVASPFTMALTTTDMDLHDDGASFDGHASWRFTNVPIQQGATILNAEIQFEVEEQNGGVDDDPLTIVFTGHDIDDSPAHTTTAGDISDRVPTSANVTWAIPDWENVGDRGANQLTPDLSTIVQEIVDRGGWVAGNDLTIMDLFPPDDEGHRHAESDEDPNPAELTIDYLGFNTSPMLYDDITFTAIKLTDHFMEGVDYHYNQTAIEEPLGELVIPSGAWCNISSTICNTDWDSRFQITIDNTQVSGSSDHTDFPVMVSITGTDFTDNLDDPADSLEDIRFLNSASDTLLDYEIEKFDKTDDELVAWIEIPTLEWDQNTIIYMYFDNAGSPTDQQNAVGVWDSGYKAVWHLDHTSGTAFDSTSNNNDGTENISPDSNMDSIGVADGADDLDGIDDWIDIGDTTSMDGATVATFEAWVNVDSWDVEPILRKWTAGEQAFIFGLRGTDELQLTIRDGANQLNTETTNANLSTDTWYYVVGVWSGGNDRKFIIDGTIEPTMNDITAGNPSSIANVAEHLGIGARYNGGSTDLFIDGTIDEVRMSDVVRSDDWIETTYNTINSPNTFYSLAVNSCCGGGGISWGTNSSATVTFTPEDNNSDWLVLGTANYNEGSNDFNEQIETRLFVVGAETDLPEISQLTADTNEFQVHSFARPLILPNSSSSTLEIQSQIDGTQTTENRTSSSIFAINLDLFSFHEETWIESTVALGTTEFGNEISEVIISPDKELDTVIISDFGFNSNQQLLEARVQENNADTLPDQTTNSYDFEGSATNDDIRRWTLQTVEVFDNATHTIETDASVVSITNTPTAVYRSLVAFTLEALEPPPLAPQTACMQLELMSVAVGEDLSTFVVPTFDTPKEDCVTTGGGADILRTFTWDFTTPEIPFMAEEVGIVKLSRLTNNTNEDFTGTVYGLFGELQWVFDP